LAVASALTGHVASAHATGSTTIGQAGQQIVQSVGKKGTLAKVGGTKGAAGIAGGLAVATITTVVVLSHQNDSPALRYREARQVLASYLATSNRAFALLDSDPLAKVEAEPLLSVDRGTITWIRKYHTGKSNSWQWRNPTFWIPRIHGKRERWFAAMAGPGSAKTDLGIVLVFAKHQGRWRVVLSAWQPDPSQRYPRVALDKQGFAREIRANDPHYLIPPGKLSERLTFAQNAAVRDGGNSSGDPRFASGFCTSRFGQTINKNIQVNAGYGWTNTIPTFPSPTPAFALKTTTGAIVWLTQRRANYMTNAKGSSKRHFSPDFPGATKVAAVQYSRFLNEQILSQSAAFVPSGSSGQVTMISCNDWLRGWTGG
jgi:hypothetical protein